MKTKSFLIAALIVVGAVVRSVAGDEPGSKGFAVLSVKGSQVFKVVYKAETVGKVKLNLVSPEGKLIYSESLSSDGFILPLNFAGLEYGQYTIELIDATGKRSEKVIYEAQFETKYFHVRKLIDSKDKFLLAISGAKENETINVRIYDAYDNLIHTEQKEVNGSFAQVYNLKNSRGAVTFEVSDNFGKTKVVSF